MKDKDGVDIQAGDTIYKGGYLFTVVSFIDWGTQIEVVCEDKLSKQVHLFLLQDILKI